MDKELKSLGEELRKKRTEKNISLKEVAEEVGVSTMYISEIERNKKVPSDEVVKKLAEIYNIEEKELFERFGRVSGDMLEELTNNKFLYDTLFEASNSKLTNEQKDELYRQIHQLYKNFTNK